MINALFLFRFASNGDALCILTKGLYDKFLNLIPWKLNFQLMLEKITTALVWIQFLGLPFEYWNNESIVQLASFIGRLDNPSLTFERGCFVFIFVEIILSECSSLNPMINNNKLIMRVPTSDEQSLKSFDGSTMPQQIISIECK